MQTRNRSLLNLTALEDRATPAVVVSNVGADLLVEGTGEAENINVSVSVGFVDVDGLDGTEVEFAEDFDASMFNGSVTIVLAGGEDTLTVDNSFVPGDLSTFGGDTTLVTSSSLAGGLSVTTGNFDDVEISNIFVPGVVTVSTGVDTDINITSGTFLSDVIVTAAGEPGEESFTDINVSSSFIGGSLVIDTIDTANEVTVNSVSVMGDVLVFTGEGDDDVAVESFFVAGDLLIGTFGGDDDVTVANGTVLGDAILDGGVEDDAEDTLELTGVYVGGDVFESGFDDDGGFA